MQVEYWEASERDKRRGAAFAATPEGKKILERERKGAFLALEWRMKHEGFVPCEEIRLAYENWKAGKLKF